MSQSVFGLDQAFERTTPLIRVDAISAIKAQASGTLAIITNIDDTARGRERFWQAVEGNESKRRADRMSVDISQAPDFWLQVAAHEQCPAELRDALLSDDDADRQHFEITSGKAVRSFLQSVPGWVAKRKKREGETAAEYRANGNPLANFHDGRGGRIQQRIIFELPSEASMAGRMNMMRRFGYEFERRGLLFNAVMHAPDHGSDERQWHVHLDYYHRPARRVTQANVDDAISRGLVPDGNVVGQWDFEAKFYEGSRRDRFRRPFKQDTLKEVRGDEWIPNLRARLAFAVNEELRAEGHQPRYDPRKYDLMGIKAEPGEHLGVKLNAAEGKGEVSETGSANESKQWRAIEGELEARFVSAIAATNAAANRRHERLQSLNLPPAQAAAIESGIDAIVALGKSEADATFEGAYAHELAARACSRANHIYQKSDRLISKDGAGQLTLSESEKGQRIALRDAASSYLERLLPFRDAVRGTVQQSEKTRAETMARSRATERVVEKLLADAEAQVGKAQPGAHEGASPAANIVATQIDATQSVAPAVRDSRDEWVTRVKRERPLIAATREGFRLVEEAEPEWIQQPAVQNALRHQHEEQEREVQNVLRERRFRMGLVAQSDGSHLRGQGPDAARRFRVLRHHPSVADAIARITAHPGAVHPSVRHDRPPENTVRSTGALADASTSGHKRSETDLRPPVKEASPLITRKVKEAPITPPSGQALLSPQKPEERSRPDRSPKPSSVDQIIKALIPLKLDEDGRIDVIALSKHGVIVANSDRSDRRLIGRAQAQGDRARRAVVAFVKQAPGFIVERDGHFSLSPKTKADIAMLARDYDSPSLQIVLQSAWEQHRVQTARQAMEASAAKVPRFTTVDRDDEAIAAAKTYQEEQRRRASTPTTDADTTRADTSEQPTSSPSQSSTGIPQRRPPPGWDRGGEGR